MKVRASVIGKAGRLLDSNTVDLHCRRRRRAGFPPAGAGTSLLCADGMPMEMSHCIIQLACLQARRCV